jgi:uncharacterized protein
MQRNRLAHETSPYLKQHADNPVDWYPWGQEALAAAQREDKPILLSVGYSACHWCHVMAHESFEDTATAELMNRHFVNIKVDREERPDLDRIYQTAQQLITGQGGGWPLTMFLSPEDQRPFFGGTYFPREARFGLPAFRELLLRVFEYYRSHAAEIRAQGARLAATLEEMSPEQVNEGVSLDGSPVELARAALESSFDAAHGGFGHAPKFPHPGSIERCLRDKALGIARLTLTRMAEGGIYDQLGGGFARYSVDEAWTIPHFEKMLYDNGQLLGTYAAAAQAMGDKLFAHVAGETADWLLRDMRSPEGGFYSSLDADSEGHEGKFYLWTRAEAETLLTAPEYAAVARCYGLDGEPNFEGAWHLNVRSAVESETQGRLLAAARRKLLAARTLRVWPQRDEKILTSWNALTIKGLAIAARVLHRPDLAEAAGAAVDFIHRALWQGGRLLATYKDGRAHLRAYLDDYAFLAEALLELLQTRWRSRDLEFARALAEVMLEQFLDRERGGFFFTAAEHEPLIHRGKTFNDESIPAGNGVAVSVLTRLGYLLGEVFYLETAERTLKAAWPSMRQYPQGHLSLVSALEDHRAPLEIVIIRGPAGEIRRWSRAISAYAPTRMVFAIPSDETQLPPALAEKHAASGTLAYLCTGTTCAAPISDLGELERRLNED